MGLRDGGKNIGEPMTIKRRTTNKMKHYRLSKVGFACPICGVKLTAVCSKSPSFATIEHIIPLDQGGDNRIQNIEIICLACNRARNYVKQDYQNRNLIVPIEYWQCSLIGVLDYIVNAFYREYHELFLKVRNSH